jgi:hypothetical protein
VVTEAEKGQLYQKLIEQLNKPLRVCGMVENTGEPGGGPFWVKKSKTQTSGILKICHLWSFFPVGNLSSPRPPGPQGSPQVPIFPFCFTPKYNFN